MTGRLPAEAQRYLVAIDGPVASGKTAVGRTLASRLGWQLFDTGIMYRAATWQAQQHSVHFDQPETVAELIGATHFTLRNHPNGVSPELHVFVDGLDATPHLRDPAVESGVPTVAAITEVRQLMVGIQQRESERGRMIVVGRDIGTVVLPNAPVKIFLDASEAVRARRRAAEGLSNTDENAVLLATRRRDARDRSRQASPLVAAEDAVILDTSDLSLEGAVNRVEAIVRERIPDIPDLASLPAAASSGEQG